jgi:hypothetical protein
MRMLPATVFLWLGGAGCPAPALADAPAPASAQQAAPSDDRLLLSANGSTLTGTGGGGGGAVGWLHEVNAGTLIGASAEYQTIANAHWTFGSLSGALTRGSADARWSLYGEIHEGSGAIGTRTFDYSILTAGVTRMLPGGFSLQLEERQIDIDTSHGSLPKIGLSLVWNPRLVTGLQYAHSAGGNLGTEVFTARIDYYGRVSSVLVGAALGHTAPAVVNVQGASLPPVPQQREAFLGLSKPFGRVELLLLGDYLKLADSKRFTLTLNCTIHLPGRNRPGR